MTADFLLELLSEEIPARMQVKAKADLERLFVEELAKAGLEAEAIETFATPRRLALIAKGLRLETQAVSEETKGPKVGAPPQAMEGFLRKVGLNQDQLVERDGVYFAVVERAGRKTADVLAEAIPAIIRAFPWPKSMRWGTASLSTESLRWVRPLQGIIALLGDDIVECAIDGITSGRMTMGHRFMHSGPVEVANASSYADDLRTAHVLVHFSERCDIIRTGAAKAATDVGLVLVEDEALVAENAGLTEWPVPLLGRFDPTFLAVPEEVIQLTARVNQKYFVCKSSHSSLGEGDHPQDGGGVDAPPSVAGATATPPSKLEGDLTNAFVCTANIVANDGGAAIIAGNEKVLAARLSDAKFFWEADLKVPLEDQAAKLSNIVFHEKLRTVADKVERVAKLARWLVEEGIVASSPLVGEDRGAGRDASASQKSHSSDGAVSPHPNPSPQGGGASLANQAERAARLCKADLVTGMVGEFPELQGIMGGYYARAQGEDDAVADAIRDHYKPVGQGDAVPTAPVTVAVSLADKLDTLAGFFIIGEAPTGSKDPYALRRAAISSIALILKNKLRFRLGAPLSDHMLDIHTSANVPHTPAVNALKAFFVDRLKVQQRDNGVRHDVIDTVSIQHGSDDLVRLLARVKALQAFIETAEGKDLLAGYKRAANILKQNPSPPEGEGGVRSAPGEGSISPNPSPSASVDAPPSPSGGEGVEALLLSALNTAEPLAASAVREERFADAMAALASLRTPIDAFFEGVMVNDPDPDIRAFRLGLLIRFRNAVHQVADFSKIEG